MILKIKVFLTGHNRPPFINEAGYSSQNIYGRKPIDREDCGFEDCGFEDCGFMDNRRRAMDKPMDSELPTGLSTALPGSRLSTSSTATTAKSRPASDLSE